MSGTSRLIKLGSFFEKKLMILAAPHKGVKANEIRNIIISSGINAHLYNEDGWHVRVDGPLSEAKKLSKLIVDFGYMIHNFHSKGNDDHIFKITGSQMSEEEEKEFIKTMFGNKS